MSTDPVKGIVEHVDPSRRREIVYLVATASVSVEMRSCVLSLLFSRFHKKEAD